MAKTKEELITEIMKEAEADGEPITKEEAEEMAEMEIKAKGLNNYVQSEPTKKKVKRERKTDAEKQFLLDLIAQGLSANAITTTVENEVRLHFDYNKSQYTVTLTKHRPPK